MVHEALNRGNLPTPLRCVFAPPTPRAPSHFAETAGLRDDCGVAHQVGHRGHDQIELDADVQRPGCALPLVMERHVLRCRDDRADRRQRQDETESSCRHPWKTTTYRGAYPTVRALPKPCTVAVAMQRAVRELVVLAARPKVVSAMPGDGECNGAG